jgi:hypothetical protein
MTDTENRKDRETRFAGKAPLSALHFLSQT